MALDPNVDWGFIARAVAANPLQDATYAAFLRNAGAEESTLLDEIRYRTEQSQREINRRAAGFEAQRADQRGQFDAELTKGTRNINEDFGDRGLTGSSAQGSQTDFLSADVNRRRGAAIGELDQTQLQYEADQRDSLASANRQLSGNVEAVRRKKVEEELAARRRLGQASSEKANFIA